MAHKTLHETDEGLAVDYVFPIVSSDVYEELQMIAIPDMAHQRVAIAEDKIAINQVKDLFFKSSEVLSRQALNTSWDIVEVRKVHSISESQNCLAQQAVDTINKAKCPMSDLPQYYDEWKPLPNHQEYMFYTTYMDETYLQCSGKERFTQAMGIVTIPPGCMVKSRTGIIYGSTDKVATFKQRYAVMTADNLEIPKDEATIVPIELQTMEIIHDDTDKVLQEAAQDLTALDTSTTWMWVAITLGNVIAVVIIAAIGIYICRRCNTSQTIKQPNDCQNENIELAEASQCQQTPVPAPRVWKQYVSSKV
ncbi:unnamed protein product [Diamesa tonsa]